MHTSVWKKYPCYLRNLTNGDVYENGMTFGKRLEMIDLKNRFLNVDWLLYFVYT